MTFPSFRRTLALIVAKAVISGIALMTLGAYVWLAQRNYDVSNVKPTLVTILLYGSLIAGAGMTYDFAKRILFLPDDTFIRFVRNNVQGFCWFLGSFVIYLLSKYMDHPESVLTSWLLFAISLIPMGFAIDRFGKAFEAALNDEQTSKPLSAEQTTAAPTQMS